MFFWSNWNTGMETVVKEHCALAIYVVPFVSQCRRYKGYISRISRLHTVANLLCTGLSAPFSSPSCLVVFIERAPGSHSTGMLSVSPSPPALELLFPARVYSAFCQSLTYTNQHSNWLQKKKVSRESLLECCNVSGPFGKRNVPHWQINKEGLECGWLKCPQDVTISV